MFEFETPAQRWLRKIGTIEDLEELDAWKQWLGSDGTVLPPLAAAAFRATEIRLLQERVAALSKAREKS